MTTPAFEDDDFTELRDAQISRMDGVGKGANGTKFLIAKQADGAGLLSADFVRGLIGKSAEPTPQEETVTMTGSPGAIAKLMHEAAVRAAGRDDVEKAEKTTASINDLPDSDFAYIEPGGKKDDEGKTAPRSLRHFPIMDAAHTRNALSRAPQSPFGDKAMPKIRAAAKKFDIDVAKMMDLDDAMDGDDPMMLLAEHDGETPGNPTMPGSPAWEAIDAATACKWTAILARAKAAIDMLAEREMLEAAAGDEDDLDNAFDLQDACCAIDYAISVLAPFAVAEQAEADCAEDMQMVGKALAGFDPAPLDLIETLGHVRKAGRVLSAGNEAAIRGAVESLQKVLASLPAAPATDDSGRPVAKTANEEPDMPTPAPSDDATAASGQEPAMGTQQAEPKPTAGLPVTDMAKADDKPEMVAVFNANGKLVGIVDPTKITMVSGASADDDGTSDEPSSDMDGADTSAPAAPETTDLTPEPPAEAGTPAEAVNKTTTDTEMFKSSLLAAVESAFTEHSANQNTVLTKQSEAVLELASMVETLKGRIGTLEEQPAMPKVFTNGAVPPHDARGMDRSAGNAQIDVAKARERKDALYKAADATEQNRIAQDMQASAIDALQAIHQQRR